MNEELDRLGLWNAYIHALCEICGAEVHVNYLNQKHFVDIDEARLLLTATDEQKARAFAAVSEKG